MKALIIFIMISLGNASIQNMLEGNNLTGIPTAAKGIWYNPRRFSFQVYHTDLDLDQVFKFSRKFICPEKFKKAYIHGGSNTSWQVYCTNDLNSVALAMRTTDANADGGYRSFEVARVEAVPAYNQVIEEDLYLVLENYVLACDLDLYDYKNLERLSNSFEFTPCFATRQLENGYETKYFEVDQHTLNLQNRFQEFGRENFRLKDVNFIKMYCGPLDKLKEEHKEIENFLPEHTETVPLPQLQRQFTDYHRAVSQVENLYLWYAIPFKKDDIIQLLIPDALFGDNYLLVLDIHPTTGKMEVEYLDKAEWFCNSNVRKSINIILPPAVYRGDGFQKVAKQKYIYNGCKPWKCWFKIWTARKEWPYTCWSWVIFIVVMCSLIQWGHAYYVWKDYNNSTLSTKQTWEKIDFSFVIAIMEYIFYFLLALDYALSDYWCLRGLGFIISGFGIFFNIVGILVSASGGGDFTVWAYLPNNVNGFFNGVLACRICAPCCFSCLK